MAWYINQSEAQRQIESMASGTSVRMISKADIEDLEVSIPPLDVQKKIIELSELWQRERILMQTITEKKGTAFSNLFIRKH